MVRLLRSLKENLLKYSVYNKNYSHCITLILIDTQSKLYGHDHAMDLATPCLIYLPVSEAANWSSKPMREVSTKPKVMEQTMIHSAATTLTLYMTQDESDG